MALQESASSTATRAPAKRPEEIRARLEGRIDEAESGGKAARFAERRAELAGAALTTLAELGYARTSLREIAQNSSYSHGVLHYYFADKVDLITECVRMYKAECVKRYDDVVEESRTAEELRNGFADAFSMTLVEDAALHRLWYDLRNQSMFETSFSDDVDAIDAGLQAMVWRVVSRYAELAGRPLTVAPAHAYSVIDGLFQHALIRHANGDASAPDSLRTQGPAALDMLVPPAR